MRRYSHLGWGSVLYLAAFFSFAMSYGSLAQTPAPTVNAVFPPLPGSQYYNDFNEYVLTSHLVNGINPSLSWASVDKGPGATGGQYQWSNFDSQIEVYIKAGKKVNIIVWPVSEGGVNTATPSYVMNSGIDIVTCTSYPGNGTKDSGFPVAWESTFKDNYKNFIVEVIQHFTGNLYIGYIRFGLTVGGEIYPFCASQWPLPAGYTSFKSALLSYDKEMLDYIKSQQPPMTVEGPTTKYSTSFVYVDTEAANAVADGFGFGSQGLQASDITNYPNCVTNWCNLFNQYYTQAPVLELQTLGRSDPTGACGTTGYPACIDKNQKLTGPLPPLITFAAQHHPTALEIYSADLLLALDPNYPGYSTYHTAYQDALAAVEQ